MATTKPIEGGKHAAPSARDLTAYQWRAAKILPGTNDGKARNAALRNKIDVAGTGDDVFGVIENPGAAAGKTTTLQTLGRTKLKVGEDVQPTDKLRAGQGGVGVKADAGEAYFFTVMESGKAGSIVPVEFDRGTVPNPQPTL